MDKVAIGAKKWKKRERGRKTDKIERLNPEKFRESLRYIPITTTLNVGQKLKRNFWAKLNF